MLLDSCGMYLPPEILARIVHWLYQSGDKLTATRLLISHKNPELVDYCKKLEQPVVFIVKFDTNSTYTVCINGSADNLTVDWGDGRWCTYNGDTKIYNSYQLGEYRIRMWSDKLIGLKHVCSVISFPTIGKMTSIECMFYQSNINIPLVWDTSLVTDMSYAFYGASKFNQELRWDTSACTDMQEMFFYTLAFNKSLNWDTSSCVNMRGMFWNALEFDQPLNFNTSNCKNMADMFLRAPKFNQPLNWNTSKVKYMYNMFSGAKSFNQPLNWDTSSVINMDGMFSGAQSFNQPLNWDTSNVTTMYNMFSDARNFNQPLRWNTQKCEFMDGMFLEAPSFNSEVDFGNNPNINYAFDSDDNSCLRMWFESNY